MMKKCKILGTAAAMMLVLALAGCENNTDDVDALKKRVDQMEQELADMEINNNLAESSQDCLLYTSITAGLRGSSSGMPASTFPTRSAPTSAALV